MTGPSLLRCPAPRADVPQGTPGGREEETTAAVADAPHALVERLRQDDAVAQFGRFVLVGGISSLLYAVVFVCSRGLGDQAANLFGAVLSSVLANELHRRLTFHADGRVSWFTAQWEGGAVALVGIVATGVALEWLDDTTGVTGAAARLLLVGLVTGALGLVRFAVLRWIFTPRGRRRV
ncbi:MAG: uncharacterized protein JWO98_191 [Frankiales bacterium]|nr:uncharacterized protein [Frankiales bacterium]